MHQSVSALCDWRAVRQSQRAAIIPKHSGFEQDNYLLCSKICNLGQVWPKACLPSTWHQVGQLHWELKDPLSRWLYATGPGFSWELSFLTHDIPRLLGLPPDMVTGFQKQPSQESLVEVTLPWKSCGVTSAATVLSLPIFKKNLDPTSQWKERQSHIARRMCGMGDHAVTAFGKSRLSHHALALWYALSKRVDTDFWLTLRNGHEQ